MTSRASVLTVHRRSGRHNLARYRHFRTILEHTEVRAPLDVKSSAANRWSSMHGVETFFRTDSLHCASSRYLSTHPSAAPAIAYCQLRILRGGGCFSAMARVGMSAAGFPAPFGFELVSSVVTRFFLLVLVFGVNSSVSNSGVWFPCADSKSPF